MERDRRQLSVRRGEHGEVLRRERREVTDESPERPASLYGLLFPLFFVLIVGFTPNPVLVQYRSYIYFCSCNTNSVALRSHRLLYELIGRFLNCLHDLMETHFSRPSGI
jgi:hypothetical protein